MRIYFDTEFVDTGSTIDLISIGMVSDRGAELYLEQSGVDHALLPAWHREHVVPHLRGDAETVRTREAMRSLVLNWVARECGTRGSTPVFWARYGAYDWVALCQLFGRMLDIPAEWPKHAMDLKQLETMLGVRGADLPPQDGTAHDALADAHWNRRVHHYLTEVTQERDVDIMLLGRA